MFDQDSRYASLEPIPVRGPSGQTVQIAPIRFIPEVDPVIGRRIRQGDRPDLLAYEFYKEPQRFWRIADANAVTRPADLVATPGALVGIPPRE